MLVCVCIVTDVNDLVQIYNVLSRHKVPMGTLLVGPLNRRHVGLRLPTEIAIYLGKGTKWAEGYYGMDD